jgi:hypothetical protein
VGQAGLSQVTLWVDDVRLAQFDGPPYEAWWQLAPGAHLAWAEGMRPNGERVVSAQVRFEVVK